MGACSSTTETDEEYLKKNNTEYTKTLFQYCSHHEIPFIYASSASVYGDGALGFDDKTPTENYHPMHGYGRSKAEADIWVSRQQRTPPVWYGLRFFNVYGPNEYHKGSMCSVVFKAYHQIRETGRLKLFRSLNPKYKDGEQMRDFIYVKEVTRWMIELFQEQKAKSGAYNMGYGQARTWLDLAKAVFKSLRMPEDIDWIDLPDNLKNQYQYFTEAKMSHFLDQGMSRPQWSLEQGVEDYILNYLSKEDPLLRPE
jgi:ADP-L-glycero-D-manno-heptose 6-epimerase